jgi:ABC-type antimicrobial peptide transport system permease subunit
MWELMAEGSDPETGETVVATVHSVAGRYFDTLGIELVRGRDFTDSEMREGGDVVIVSAGLAERLFGESGGLGRRLRSVGSTEARWYRVVGVVRDVDIGRDMVANDLPAVQLYQPYASNPTAPLAVAARVRAGRDPEILASTLRETLQGAAPGIPVSDVLTMDDAVFRVRWVSRFFSRQLFLYALAATLVTAVGLYGLAVDSVVTRTRELAVRLALGAERRALVRMVMRESVVLSAAGVSLGLLVVLLVSRAASSMLVSVSSRDPLALGLGAVALLLVAATAAFLPARRASTVDPMRALRAE